MISEPIINSKNELIKKAEEIISDNESLNPKSERWRFSPIKEFSNFNFSGNSSLTLNTNKNPQIDECIQIEIQNGKVQNLESLPSGIDLIEFGNDIEQICQKLSDFGNIGNPENYYFSAENTGQFSNCIVLIIDENQTFEKPIHLVHNQTEQKEYTRIFIHCKKNSELKIIESYNNSINNSYQNSVIEILMEQDSNFEHYCIQNGNDSNWQFYTIGVNQNRNSNFKSTILSTSGYRNINEIFCNLKEEGAETEISGLYVADGISHRDNHTKIIHSSPNTFSTETFKGILAGKSSGVFNGIVVVEQDAQKINSDQSNRNLLLSTDAQMNSNPQLEIYADDVKCSHGSTTGQIDDDALFYMRSRGISESLATKILVKGFAGEILDKIKVKSVIDFIEPKIEELVENN